jgi:hypothetical protein
MRGLPNTAMLPKGGYDLTDEQVRGLVTWMVRQVQDAKVSQTQAIRVPIASSQLFNPSGNATLGELGEQLAVGLRMALGEASNAIEPVGPQTWLVRGLGIRVMAQGGVVTLSGTVHESRTVEQAATWVGQQPGVSQVVNRLVAASLFEWD